MMKENNELEKCEQDSIKLFVMILHSLVAFRWTFVKEHQIDCLRK